MTVPRASSFKNTGTFAIADLQPELVTMFEKTLRDCRTLLDYGCGYGGWLRYFLAINRDFRYDVFDPDQAAEQFARDLAPGRYDALLDTFDVIVCFAVLELLSEAKQVDLLKTLAARLNPGGRLLVQYNVFNPLAPRWLLFAIMGKGNAKAFHQKFRFNRSYLSSTQIEQLFQSAGFKVVECRTNKFWHRLPPALNGVLMFILHSRRFHSQLFYRLDRCI